MDMGASALGRIDTFLHPVWDVIVDEDGLLRSWSAMDGAYKDT